MEGGEKKIPQLEINTRIEIPFEDINNNSPTKPEPPKEISNNIEEEKKEQEPDYDLNKDYNFLSILQFINLFHKVLGISPVSTTELEFSLLHTDIDPLCCNILSKLLLKKEQHRPTKQNKEKEKDNNNANLENQSENNVEKNHVSNINNSHNNQKNNNNLSLIFNEENLLQLNENLMKKLNYFYKVYIRYLKKIYNVTETSKVFEIIKTDLENFKNDKINNDYYSLTKKNLTEKYFDDCDIKTELIVKLFRELEGIHPLRNINSIAELEILMSNKDNIEITENNENNKDENNNNSNSKNFENLTVKQKVILLMFFCNYCMSFSGRQPLYLEEIYNNKDENFINNKRIIPLYKNKHNNIIENNYIFPLNKDCRIYKENLDICSVSNNKTFDLKIKNYEELEKLLETLSDDPSTSKKLKEKLIELKTNDEEEKKKINSNQKKEELHLKAKQLSEMNKQATSEKEIYKNADFLLMNLSDRMMTRHQLNQITQLSQVSTRNRCNQLLHPKEKPKELTAEEKHKLKVEKENLEREKRMQKRNKIIEQMQKEEEYKLLHPEEAKFLNNKKKRDNKKKHKKKHAWSDDEEDSNNNEEDEELLKENFNYSESSKSKTKNNQQQKKIKKNTNINIEISDDEEIENNNENQNSSSDIVNEGFLIYRFSSNQIELEGNWYMESYPDSKERMSYLFSGSQLEKKIPLIIENNQTTINLCSANIIECLQIQILFKSCLDFLMGNYKGYFMYYGKTIEDTFNMNLEVQDSLVKVNGIGNNSLGNFSVNGYMNFFRSKEIIMEKNDIKDQVIKIAEFKISKVYTEFNPVENEKVIKSFNHRRKKNNEYYNDDGDMDEDY